MTFERNVQTYLDDWRLRENRKPLIIRGARQVGKTTLIASFSRSYQYSIMLNLEKANDRDYFDNFDDVKSIIEVLFLANRIPSSAVSNTLLFIDEIQENPKAIQLLRYFYEEIPELHVICAGSLLEFAMKEVRSFPVGRVEFLYLYPLNFQEYLKASGNQELLKYLLSV